MKLNMRYGIGIFFLAGVVYFAVQARQSEHATRPPAPSAFQGTEQADEVTYFMDRGKPAVTVANQRGGASDVPQH